MARFSSSRHSLHRHLWFSGLRKGDDSPLGSLLLRAKPNAFLIPRSSIQNRRLCDPNVTCRIRLLLFDAVSSWRSLKIYQDVLVVMYLLQKSGGEIYDAVVLNCLAFVKVRLKENNPTYFQTDRLERRSHINLMRLW